MKNHTRNTSVSALARFQTIISDLKKRLGFVQKRLLRIIDQRPLFSFFGLLAILLILIVVGEILRRPKEAEKTADTTPKKVTVYSVGASPKLAMSAKIEKSGVIHLVAQSGGVVQMINSFEGATVKRGAWLFSLSTNYQGGSIPSLSRQIAEKSYDTTTANYESQVESIRKRREIANKTETQAETMRAIGEQALNDTREIISLNEEFLNSINDQIVQLEAANAGGSNDALIAQAKQSKAGILSALSSLKNASRNAELQTADDREPAQLAALSHDLTIEALNIEERSINLNKEVSLLNLNIARISVSLMYPASPVDGVVERIHVQVGQSVGPGTLLATIASDKNTTTAVVRVSRDLAQKISRLEKSTVVLGGKTIELTPRYISSEPTEGTLYGVLYSIPEEYADVVGDQSNIVIEIPVGNVQTTAAVPFVPIDALYQTPEQAYLYVASSSADGSFTAKTKEVRLGDVLGSYVQVLTGLSSADQIILNRNIIDGDLVAFK